MPKGGKYDRCVKKVSKKNEDRPTTKRVNPYAVCTTTVGRPKKRGKK
jgi:hypothetical protein